MTRKKLVKDNPLTYVSCQHSYMVFKEETVIDEFHVERGIDELDGSETYRFVDPIIILFNQERIQQLGAGVIKAVLDSMQPSSSALADLRSKCPDDLLIQMIKSRYLQAPSEIKSWCEFMSNNLDQFNLEVEKLKAEQNTPSSDSSDESNV